MKGFVLAAISAAVGALAAPVAGATDLDPAAAGDAGGLAFGWEMLAVAAVSLTCLAIARRLLDPAPHALRRVGRPRQAPEPPAATARPLTAA